MEGAMEGASERWSEGRKRKCARENKRKRNTESERKARESHTNSTSHDYPVLSLYPPLSRAPKGKFLCFRCVCLYVSVYLCLGVSVSECCLHLRHTHAGI